MPVMSSCQLKCRTDVIIKPLNLYNCRTWLYQDCQTLFVEDKNVNFDKSLHRASSQCQSLKSEEREMSKVDYGQSEFATSLLFNQKRTIVNLSVEKDATMEEFRRQSTVKVSEFWWQNFAFKQRFSAKNWSIIHWPIRRNFPTKSFCWNSIKCAKIGWFSTMSNICSGRAKLAPGGEQLKIEYS